MTMSIPGDVLECKLKKYRKEFYSMALIRATAAETFERHMQKTETRFSK